MIANNNRPGTSEAFDRSHAGRMQNTTVERIYRAAFGDDYPTTAQPNAFYSRTTLQCLASALGVGPGRIVVDLGCGHGGPSVWVAQQTGANLIGIDLSPVGIDLARRRAAELGLSDQSRFEVGDLTTTGLPDASCDAAMSLDVLLFVPDKAAAVRANRRPPSPPRGRRPCCRNLRGAARLAAPAAGTGGGHCRRRGGSNPRYGGPLPGHGTWFLG
jgi:2-polyprenyl-3-methyl-5-hydroxy-6-metoxy-1,4-benzoquinol methylase